MTNQRIIITLPEENVQALDGLVQHGIAPSRNALIEKIIAGFLSDVKERRQAKNSALGNLVGFILLLLGLGVIASIFGESEK
jgi:metal-responsive CopG/Arc/MetJ family transcriptional regulator